MRNQSRLLLALLPALLAACSSQPPSGVRDSAPDRKLDPDTIVDAVPRDEPRSRYGNPKSYAVFGRRYQVMESSAGHREKGIASWYGSKFHGRRTSSGEAYDMYAMTAAHKNLPLPTYVRVTNLRNGRSAVVKVNDRGPFHDNRIIDLSYAAATKLGILATGTGLVEISAIDVRQQAEPDPQAVNVAQPADGEEIPGVFIQVGAFSSGCGSGCSSRSISRFVSSRRHARPLYCSGSRSAPSPMSNKRTTSLCAWRTWASAIRASL